MKEYTWCYIFLKRRRTFYHTVHHSCKKRGSREVLSFIRSIQNCHHYRMFTDLSGDSDANALYGSTFLTLKINICIAYMSIHSHGMMALSRYWYWIYKVFFIFCKLLSVWYLYLIFPNSKSHDYKSWKYRFHFHIFILWYELWNHMQFKWLFIWLYMTL